ncbi:MAG: NTP transferase domain-containing protein [Planctomycetes bacterium]|nr:NTP transferase domain-containing protein [Planctomycetota bacterium]
MPRVSPIAGIILAAGLGKRMRSRVPKGLFPLLGRPLLEYPLRLLESLSLDPICVVIGAGGDEVKRRFAERRVLWATQDPPRGTGDAALVGLRALPAAARGSHALIVNGDLPLLEAETIEGMLAAHRSAGAAFSILTQVRADPTGYGRIVRDAGREIARIVEEADATAVEKRIAEINGGVYVGEREALAAGLAALAREAAPNAQGEIYLPPVAAALRGRGCSVRGYELPGERGEQLAQVNTRAELAAVAAIRRRRIIDGLLAAGVTVVDPPCTYIEADVEIGEDTVILPYSVIEAGVRIGRNCVIGPFAHLRAGTQLAEGAEIGNFTEVKNTRLGAGSKAKHLAYLGDGEVGAGVNIGAGTIFANFDGKEKHPTRVGDGASLGSGTILVAPVEVGRNARTGAGAVVARGRDIPEGETHVGIPARKLETRAGGAAADERQRLRRRQPGGGS